MGTDSEWRQQNAAAGNDTYAAGRDIYFGPSASGRSDLQAVIEELRRELANARQQLFGAEAAREVERRASEQRVQELTAQLQEARSEADRERDAHGAAAILMSIGQPVFRRVPADYRGGDTYHIPSVDRLMVELRNAAARGTAALAQVLAFNVLSYQEPRYTSPYGRSSPSYAAEDIDAYLAVLRQALNGRLSR